MSAITTTTPPAATPAPPLKAAAPSPGPAAVIRRLESAAETPYERLIKKHLPGWVISGGINIGLVACLLLVPQTPPARATDKVVATSVEKEDAPPPENLTNEDPGLQSNLEAALPELQRVEEKTVDAAVTNDSLGQPNRRTHAGEHRVTAVGTGDTGDQLGENNRLAQTGTAEQTGLTAADERREQVDNLDARFEQFGLGRQVGRAAARRGESANTLGIDRAATVDRLADQVEHAAERGLPTGTFTGAPVSMQSWPRTMPSVLPKATQRTRPPPKCCCTSPVRLTFTPLCSEAIFTAL